MITTFLIAHTWLTTVALVALVVLGTPLAAWLATRPRAAYVLAAVAALPIAVLTLWPTDRDLPVGCAQEWSVPTLGRVELVANVVLFVAPVLFLAVALRRPVLAVLVGSTASFGIEAFQAFVTALGRSCSTNDWLSNTIGSVLGGVLAAVALAVSRRAAGSRPASDPHVREPLAR
ncbi:VanZ like family protein [Nocardioides exalbidus]|uniref:VanZ like family protein n=1 Tax=Nocardioides exalbidus TaxID=402596 RepID=A0A1H4MXE3_9ACTN|nr:VanZ family protein [Nocardioides exalbidus]SEB87689.1 VanZ like family protein [Nocardioides exalbidus]